MWWLVYTSELNFLTALPAVVAFDRSGSRRGVWYSLMATRLALVWTGLLVKFSVGMYLLLGGVALYCVEAYATARVQSDTSLALHESATVRVYVMAYFSIVNFLLDLPGLAVASGVRALVVLANIAVFAYLVAVATTAFDYHAAWGCYGPVASLAALDGGTCNADGVAGGFPRHCIEAFTSQSDSIAHYCLHPPPLSLGNVYHGIAHLLSIACGAYFGALPQRITKLRKLFKVKQT